MRLHQPVCLSFHPQLEASHCCCTKKLPVQLRTRHQTSSLNIEFTPTLSAWPIRKNICCDVTTIIHPTETHKILFQKESLWPQTATIFTATIFAGTMLQVHFILRVSADAKIKHAKIAAAGVYGCYSLFGPSAGQTRMMIKNNMTFKNSTNRQKGPGCQAKLTTAGLCATLCWPEVCGLCACLSPSLSRCELQPLKGRPSTSGTSVTVTDSDERRNQVRCLLSLQLVLREYRRGEWRRIGGVNVVHKPYIKYWM